MDKPRHPHVVRTWTVSNRTVNRPRVPVRTQPEAGRRGAGKPKRAV